jgi:hypothetical protein
MTWYVLLIGAVALERVAELVVSQRNLAWSRARGGVEFGSDGVDPADRLDRQSMGSGDRLGERVVGVRELGSTGGQRPPSRLERVRRIAVLRHGHDRTQGPTAGQLTLSDADSGYAGRRIATA